MARTRDPASKTQRPTRKTANSDAAPKATAPQKAGVKVASKVKASIKAIETDAGEPGQRIRSAGATANTLKRLHDDSTAESEQVAPPTTKKARRVSGNDPNAGEEACDPQPPTRRSVRPQTKAPATVGKRKRRTKAEIEADKAKADAEKKRKEELTQENHRMMEQMDIDEDKDRADIAARTIRTFADLERDPESGEEFVGFDNVSSGEDTDGDSDDPMDAMKLREAHKALQKKMKALKGQIGGGKKKDAGGKKLTNKVAFASSLRPGWDNAIKESSEKPAHVQISVGGLDDSDAEAANPFPIPTFRQVAEPKKIDAQKLEWDLSRKNEMVAIVETDEKENQAPQPRVKKTAKKAGTKAIRSAQVKTEASPEASLPKETGNDEKAKPKKRLNGNNVRMSDLPEFAAAKWRDAFLPTLYDKFFASTKPFANFCVGAAEFVAILQNAVKEVWPEVDYTVTSSDSIHFLAYNRISEKRSGIGSNAIKLLQAYVKTLKGEKAVKEWLRWCLRPGGPLFFKEPSVIGSGVDPEGRLLSPFVISLAKPLLSLKAGSASENGPPQGLIAVVVAALERAARHLFDPTKKLKEFSKESWGSHVESYCKSFRPDKDNEGISDERWQELMQACSNNSQAEEPDTLDADLSILDDQRTLLFNFQSPNKRRT